MKLKEKKGWIKIGIEKKNIRKILGIKFEFRLPKKIEFRRNEIYETRYLGDQNSGDEIYGTAFITYILKRKIYLKRIWHRATQNVGRRSRLHTPPNMDGAASSRGAVPTRALARTLAGRRPRLGNVGR